MTGEELDGKIQALAQKLAGIFKGKGWTWWDTKGESPSAERIAQELRRHLADVSTVKSEAGRLFAERREDGTVELGLDWEDVKETIVL